MFDPIKYYIKQKKEVTILGVSDKLFARYIFYTNGTPVGQYFFYLLIDQMGQTRILAIEMRANITVLI